VVSGALFNEHGNLDFSVINSTLHDVGYRRQFLHSFQLSIGTAIAGAILGALFAWVVATGNSDGWFRRISLAFGGVLAQFGGVMLAFAFLATFGFNGFLSTLAMKHWKSLPIASPTWLYGLFGLGVVYTFFQIPLMFLVFLPSVENLKPQWREASDGMGGGTAEYWMRIGFPVLTPSFIGAFLLLFVNSFSAYATAAALISQGSIITPLGISGALSSEVGATSVPLAKTLSLFMIVVVVISMSLYSLIRKKVSKWEQ
jgi:putative spermidine/putrescine transport system permease protein